MQVRNINLFSFTPIKRNNQQGYHANSFNAQQDTFIKTTPTISFAGITTQKDFRDLTRNRIVHCFYCNTPMINPKYIEELKESGLFSGPIKDIVTEIAPLRKYLKPASLEVFEKIEKIAKVAPQTHLSRIIKTLHQESIARVRQIQAPILDKIEKEGRTLSPKCKKEFKRVMQLHKNRLNGVPQVEEFSAKDFAYKLERCTETITNERIKQELIQYAGIIDHSSFRNGISLMPEKVLNVIFKDKNNLDYRYPINARSMQLNIVEEVKRRGIKLGRDDIIDLCRRSEKMLMNVPVSIPFSNKSFGHDLSCAIKEHANPKTYEKIKLLLKKLPTSDSNTNSFITKHRLSDSDSIGYYLLKPSNCTIEHLVVASSKLPITHKIWDWVLACGPCNNKRADGSLAKYLEKFPQENQQIYFNDIAGVVNDGILDLKDFMVQRNVILQEGHRKLSISIISPELLKKEFGGDNPQRKFNEYIELAQKGYLDKEDIQELRKTLHKQCGILVSPHICYN